MSWTSGTRVGSYEISGLLGRGGMGEVYRARDVRLQREVALKVLPVALLQDKERLTRFEREARVLAAMSHPNIAAIYGIEDMPSPAGATPVLVLEFVDGQTLADRVAAGPIPADDAIPIGLQVAEALEAAHERGIIHRDLKPANVQLTTDGNAKVLDFGLAKALDAEASGAHADPSQSPTLTSASTELGTLMGTAAYMAPEQARGKTVDRRADIWAFGALLFEMLSGKRAFPGETISDTLAAVLTATPDWSSLPPATPPSIRQLIERCLERDPRQRLQSIGEARIVLASPRAARTVAAGGRQGVSWGWAAGIAVAAVGLSAAAFQWLERSNRATPAASLRKVDLAVDIAQTGRDRLPAISPDGSRLVYAAGGKLWLRSLEDFASKEVAETSGAGYPFWSPDGRELAFVRDFKLWRVSAEGGKPQLVGAVPEDMTGSGGGAWTSSGNFLLVGSDATGITELSAADGSSREVLPLDRRIEADIHDISALPGDRGVLFTAHAVQTDTIALLADGKRRDLIKFPGEVLRTPAYHPAGYIVFGRETTRRGIWAIRFSLDTLQTSGAAFLIDGSGTYPSVAAADGTIAIVRRSELPSEFVWIDRSGSVTTQGILSGKVPDMGPWRMFNLSPDHQKVAVGIASEGGDELWIYDLRRATMSPASRGAQMVVWPTWSRDGSRVLIGGFAGGRLWNVHSVTATQISSPELVLPPSDEPQWPCGISPDGKWLLYIRSPSRNSDLWIAPLDRPTEGKPLIVTPAREEEGHFSPDGRWLAYLSDESGRIELYVRRFPLDPDRVQVSSGGASAVSWSGDGRELFYRGGGGLMSARLIDQGGRVEPSTPQRLFELSDPALSQTFIAAPDGQRFLFARATGTDRISVILNWKP